MPASEPALVVGTGTPDERIEAAFNDMNAALRSELLERILAVHPTAFEKLIVDLMLGMDYGAGGSGQHLGRTNERRGADFPLNTAKVERAMNIAMPHAVRTRD